MVNQHEEINSLVNMLQQNNEQFYPNIDYECLKKYDENNKQFSMGILLENHDGEQQQSIGYDCIYRYGKHRIKLEYNIKNDIWKKISSESNEEKEIVLDSLFDPNSDIRSLFQTFTLDQQIQIIIKRYDKYFSEIDKIKSEQNNENKKILSEFVSKDENSKKDLNNESNELLIIHENDQNEICKNDLEEDFVDYGLHSFITGSRSKFSGLAPPVAPRRSRQNSAFSQCSARYASFIPPVTAPIRQRRVIESIVLHVKRKKKPFEKILDILKGIEPPTMHQIGLEFLRVYDGKFNYPKGHTFVMPFQKKLWSLTIDKINCVDCPAGEIGPQSTLTLKYKDRYTKVHV